VSWVTVQTGSGVNSQANAGDAIKVRIRVMRIMCRGQILGSDNGILTAAVWTTLVICGDALSFLPAISGFSTPLAGTSGRTATARLLGVIHGLFNRVLPGQWVV
jgi:hypothetical protein